MVLLNNVKQKQLNENAAENYMQTHKPALGNNTKTKPGEKY